MATVVGHVFLVCFLCGVFAQESSFKDAVVYPRFLEARSEDGVRTLKLNDDLTLNLVQQPAYKGQLLLRTTEEDGTHLYQQVPGADYNKNLFLDKAILASLVVNDEDGIQVHGIIGEDLRIRPLLEEERSEDGHLPHLLYREEPLTNNAGITDYIADPLPESRALPVQNNFTRQTGVSSIALEVHIVVDSTYFEQFNSDKNAIIVYFGASLNAINLRYDTVEGINVRIFITGFTFNKGITEEPYITYIRSGSPYGDITKTLNEFRNYHLEYPLTPEVDAIVLITGKDMCEMSAGRLQCNYQGMAFVGGVCTWLKYGVCEDKPRSYSLVRPLAHEMGHILGCVHDGESEYRFLPGHPGAQKCPFNQGYLMSYKQGTPNEFRFSPCCSKQIQFVARLPASKCLFYNDTLRAIPDSRYLPGSNISLDQVCKSLNDRTLNFEFNKYQKIRGCKVPCAAYINNRRSAYFSDATAQDGSLCDPLNNTKICVRGSCVYDNHFIHPATFNQTRRH